jgi:hypothetical protein
LERNIKLEWNDLKAFAIYSLKWCAINICNAADSELTSNYISDLGEALNILKNTDFFIKENLDWKFYEDINLKNIECFEINKILEFLNSLKRYIENQSQ